ncbi:MAG: class I SAM-dependent methyltransferase [Burkholderiaceae bacterium]|jgi:methylase of polypeptide subunit release factors|nr:class I SAM-dependent methyltransferase [Burkholderiaceae bacterium]MDP4968471.1 class I SAM-dependent methyltransferase [Burkholderiaceae bacterium]MDP5110834.1 class I SAM-dependent methyltransferase [Burkholderiaceae bacterium]
MPHGNPDVNSTTPTISWLAGEQTLTSAWRSENGWAPPKRTALADDTMSADTAYRLASEGVALIWTGDFQNARQLLQALARRTAKRRPKYLELPYPERFHQVRLARAQRARTLGMLCLPVEPHHLLTHRRAPNVNAACVAAHGDSKAGYVTPLTELLGLISAYEWRKNGVDVPALGVRIHPHYGVFAPTRSEYLELIAQAPLPQGPGMLGHAFDIGTGTGVIAALLLKRGLTHVTATDTSARALECAQENIERLGLSSGVKFVQTDLFPDGQADLIVCNPPWLPGRPASGLEHAIYDQDQHMLKGFIKGLPTHLTPQGEGWLILSDLAEHLGLRTREDLLEWIETAGLRVMERLDIRPMHGKTKDEEDPLADARRAEVTSLWRLRV